MLKIIPYAQVFLIVSLINNPLLVAQSWDEFKDDVCATGTVGKNLWQAAVQPSDDTKTGYLIGSGAVLLSLLADQSVRDFAQANQTSFGDKLFAIDDYYGSEYTIAGSVLLYAAGFFSGDKKIKGMGLRTTQALIYTGLFTVVTKEVFGRARPYTNEGPFSFAPLSFKGSNRSFFSGHTSTVFAVSTVMAHEIDNIFWKIFWYGAAAPVGVARIYHDKHWLSDVVAGAFVGYAIGRFVAVQENGTAGTTFGYAASPNQANTAMLYFSVPLN